MSKESERTSPGEGWKKGKPLRIVQAQLDCFDEANKCVYEFKCVQKLDENHRLQLACYMYLLEYSSREKQLIEDTGRLDAEGGLRAIKLAPKRDCPSHAPL